MAQISGKHCSLVDSCQKYQLLTRAKFTSKYQISFIKDLLLQSYANIPLSLIFSRQCKHTNTWQFHITCAVVHIGKKLVGPVLTLHGILLFPDMIILGPERDPHINVSCHHNISIAQNHTLTQYVGTNALQQS